MTTATIYVQRGDEEIEVEVTGEVSHDPGYQSDYDGGLPPTTDVSGCRATVKGQPFDLTDEEWERADDALVAAAGD